MGKILYPKQRGAAAAVAPAATGAAVAAPGALRTHRPDGGEAAEAADGVGGDSRRTLNGSTADRGDEKPTTAVAAAAAVQLNGTVFVSTCPVCQQCFRNYVSMSQHCRSVHGLRPSDGAFSKYPGKHDPIAGPPLAADTVAAHVAHNLSHWLHGKRQHLLAREQRGESGSPDRADADAARQPSEPDRWTADRPALSAFVGQSKADSCGEESAAAAAGAMSSAVCAGPPILIKMHDEPPAAAGSGAAVAACLPLNDTPPVLQKCVEHVKLPTFYDEPGAWKFVCLVCHKTFADKSALYAHQRSSHSHVACTHLEVEAVCPPDARAAGSRPSPEQTTPMLRGARRLASKAEPSFACAACGKRSRTTHQLHEHILACAAALAPAASAAATQVSAMTTSARVKRAAGDAAADASLWRYGKSRRYRKHHSCL